MARLSSVAALVMLAAACSSHKEPDYFANAEKQYLDQHYDDAVALFKQHLIAHPNDAGAHFYLGTCYLYSTKNGWLGIAQGELQTALSLFERQGRKNPIARFKDAEYFELISHINLAKVDLRLIYGLVSTPTQSIRVNPREAIQALVHDITTQYEAAARINPDHNDVRGLAKQIAQVTQLLNSIPPEPEHKVNKPAPGNYAA